MNKKIGEEVRPIFETYCDICGAPSECTCDTCALDICDSCAEPRLPSGRQHCVACPPEARELRDQMEVLARENAERQQPLRNRLFEIKRAQLKKYRKKDKEQEE